jgi:hypothetical protein
MVALLGLFECSITNAPPATAVPRGKKVDAGGLPEKVVDEKLIKAFPPPSDPVERSCQAAAPSGSLETVYVLPWKSNEILYLLFSVIAL